METLLILTYAAFCIAIFKIFKIPLNKWTVPTAILGGIVMIGSLILLMNYNHPYTKVAHTVVATTPIVPLVKGRVVEVPVEPNTPLKEGDVLLRLDPWKYETRVEEQNAALASAVQNVKINRESWNQAQANVERAKSDRDRTKANYDRYAKANEGKSRPFSEAEVQNRHELYLAAEASLSAAEASAHRAKLFYESQIDGEDTEVARARARLAQAEFDLYQTVIRAPTDGLVTQVIVRPGVVAVPIPLKPIMIFVHSDDTKLVSFFLQNYSQRLRKGDEAEVIFAAVPGRVFKGKVEEILPVLAEGAVQASGTLITESQAVYERVPVSIVVEEDMSEFNLPVGSAGEVAVYTEHAEHLSLLRKILFRMKSWQNYLFGEGH